MQFDDVSKRWLYKQPDWNTFKEIVKNKGPKSQDRLRLRKISYETNQWVREALSKGNN
jgi:ring-1,2-phenylacetyl-CoA epoxidase subunit PaaA